jgi:hypothetical protein
MTNEEAKSQRDESRRQLKKNVMEADGTMCDVVDEAVGHLLDHYDPKKTSCLPGILSWCYRPVFSGIISKRARRSRRASFSCAEIFI